MYVSINIYFQPQSRPLPQHNTLVYSRSWRPRQHRLFPTPLLSSVIYPDDDAVSSAVGATAPPAHSTNGVAPAPSVIPPSALLSLPLLLNPRPNKLPITLHPALWQTPSSIPPPVLLPSRPRSYPHSQQPFYFPFYSFSIFAHPGLPRESDRLAAAARLLRRLCLGS